MSYYLVRVEVCLVVYVARCMLTCELALYVLFSLSVGLCMFMYM